MKSLPAARAVGNAVFLDYGRPDEHFAVGLQSAKFAQAVAEQINKAIREAVVIEREACAVIAATASDGGSPAGKIVGPLVDWDADMINAGIAAAIRARKDQP